MKKYDYIYFCSAYNDISHILVFIEREPRKKHCIYIVNIQQCFIFTQNISIENTDVIFIESKLKRLKNPLYWIYEWLNKMQIKNKYLKNIKGAKVVFFTSFYDCLTCFCIDWLKSKNEVFLGFKNDEDFQCTKRGAFAVIFSTLYGVQFDTFSYDGVNNILGLPNSYMALNVNQFKQASKTELMNIWEKYIFLPPTAEPFILFLDADHDYEGLSDSGNKVIDNIFVILTKFNTLTKGHPRLKPSYYSLNQKIPQIKSFIPIEFVDLSKCICVVGYYSFALVNIANTGAKVISLLNVLPYVDENVRLSKIKYLEQYALGQIFFPKNIHEFEKEIASIA